MKDYLIAFAIVAAILGGISWLCYVSSERDNKCETAGGIPFQTRDNFICIDKNSVKILK